MLDGTLKGYKYVPGESVYSRLPKARKVLARRRVRRVEGVRS